MSAPNQQPAGSRPAPGKVHQHGPHVGGKPSGSGRADLGKGLPAHGAPKPVGNGKKNPLH
jgi:hypothetical protein